MLGARGRVGDWVGDGVLGGMNFGSNIFWAQMNLSRKIDQTTHTTPSFFSKIGASSLRSLFPACAKTTFLSQQFHRKIVKIVVVCIFCTSSVGRGWGGCVGDWMSNDA